MYDTTFLDELAGKAPTPGGGGASAYAGALAAALGSMVCNLTVGKKRYADVEDDIRAQLETLDDLRTRLVELVDADARAFEPLAAAYRLPKETSDELAVKNAALQEALVGACDVPLAIMRAVADVAAAVEYVAHHGSRMAVSDAGAAAVLAKGAVQAAALNIFINAASMDDPERAQGYCRAADELIAQVSERCDAVYAYVMGEIRA